MIENKFSGLKLPAPLFEKNKDGGQGVENKDPWKGRLRPEEFQGAADAGVIQTIKPREWLIHNRKQQEREEREKQQKKG